MDSQENPELKDYRDLSDHRDHEDHKEAQESQVILHVYNYKRSEITTTHRSLGTPGIAGKTFKLSS